MKEIIFSTGNELKFHNGQIACRKYGIQLKQVSLPIDEIQDENPENIALDKAKKSFAELGRPVVISDDSWDIPGLNGFPGAYMKSMNEWLAPDDFVNLTKSLTDRRIFLHVHLVFVDSKTIKLFSSTFEGYLLKEPRGEYGPSSQKVISLQGDNDLSISEVHDKNLHINGREVHKMWDEFCSWYLDYKPTETEK
jgi:inosine/xanthosine triphosphate pyrophosphatase family protein